MNELKIGIKEHGQPYYDQLVTGTDQPAHITIVARPVKANVPLTEAMAAIHGRRSAIPQPITLGYRRTLLTWLND